MIGILKMNTEKHSIAEKDLLNNSAAKMIKLQELKSNFIFSKSTRIMKNAILILKINSRKIQHNNSKISLDFQNRRVYALVNNNLVRESLRKGQFVF